jgi:hypothetical protein
MNTSQAVNSRLLQSKNLFRGFGNNIVALEAANAG